MSTSDDIRPADDHAVYAMAVAAELTGATPAMLRDYEAKGLVRPHRTAGGTRRYSPADLARVRRITELLDSGLNLAGIEAVLSLESANDGLRAEVERLRTRSDRDQGGRQGQADPRGTL